MIKAFKSLGALVTAAIIVLPHVLTDGSSGNASNPIADTEKDV